MVGFWRRPPSTSLARRSRRRSPRHEREPMKAAIPPLFGTDDTLTTGVRKATPAGDEDGLPASETMSGRRHYPAEIWDADEEAESELPVPEGALLGDKYTVERMFAG